MINQVNGTQLLESMMTVSFRPVELGDRYLTARGWLVVAYGAVRGIVSEMPDGRIHYGFACDRRLQPEDGYKLFQDLQHARWWFDERLTQNSFLPKPRPV